jgi:hypothetical protein
MGDSGKKGIKARAKADQVMNGAAFREVVLSHYAAHSVEGVGAQDHHQVVAGALNRAPAVGAWFRGGLAHQG